MAASLVNTVEDKLSSLIRDEFGLLWGINKEMKKLKSNFTAIQAVLEDAEQKQHLKENKAIQDWLRKLKDAAYQLDDILDDCVTEANLLEYSRPDWLKKVCLPFLTCFPFGINLLFSLKIGHRMKNISKRFDEINEERLKFHDLRVLVVEKTDGFPKGRETGFLLTEPQVYGRNEDKEKIVQVLIDHVNDDKDDLLVYSIIGIGGIGKTTLAQFVFNDESMASYFEKKIWVCVSDDFDVKRILKAIIQSAGMSDCAQFELAHLQTHLQKNLNGRYLLVLDDVWNENQKEWETLKCILKQCGARGSSIITTTRLEMVASIMRTHPSHSHQLTGLSEGHCWLLFEQRAFGSEREEHPNLVAIGKDIVKKCGGVPLAAKALGSLMHFKKGENEWNKVKESEIWNLPQDDETSILPALRLSYYNLRLELRRCFAYCSVFEKDREIEKTHLIHLWMANGFISSANGENEMEDIANEIWNELYWRSFFQDVKEDEFKGTITFKMHDLMHDLAHSVMDEECQIMDVKRPTNSMSNKRIRHINLIGCSAMSKEYLQNIDSLRTLLYRERAGEHRTNSPELSLFENHCALRAFSATDISFTWHMSIKKLASSIGSLKHLRYLRLCSSEITTLPDSICSLWNLQTLNLDGCSKLERWPENMKCLRNLRHLLINWCYSLKGMPCFIGELTCLKTLSKFIVEERKGCGLDELRCLDHLAGSLRIENLERVVNWIDAKKANLIAKQNLHSLQLYWFGTTEECVGHEQVLEALQPFSSNLKRLQIYGYKGTHFPSWMNNYSNLKSIVKMELWYCENCQQLPPLHQLPSLRYLKLVRMRYVEYMIISDNNNYEVQGSNNTTVRGFPCLETLKITTLPNLRGFSREEEEKEGNGPLFPRLRKLSIFNCPKLTTWPKCLSALEELTISEYEEATITSLPDNLGNFTSLQSLTIRDCPKLASIPASFQSLTKLQSLAIDGCPKLKMRCKKGGDDWDKIRHVPDVSIR